MSIISGFSKLSRQQKIDALQHLMPKDVVLSDILENYLHPNEQSLFDDISENTLSNFYLPFGIAPNFLINNTLYHLPMVTEESSVVAAASKGANFWAKHGGFYAEVKSTVKTGQIHFEWKGNFNTINNYLPHIESVLREAARPFTQKMEQRGGGIVGMSILPTGDASRFLWQLLVTFKTDNSMGANFINSCLEAMRQTFETLLNSEPLATSSANVIMSILSNYTPECMVECSVQCSIDKLAAISSGFDASDFARRFESAVYIANNDVYRASTHNKGIFNGVDAVAIATGNDFRAIEANGHVYSARNGKYSGLTTVDISNNNFTYTLQMPLSVGTVGGLTALHPLAKLTMMMLQMPNATTLMGIMAAAGLSNNFMAVTSLITTGIQKGHMKMHLSNILRTMNASEQQMAQAKLYFESRTVSVAAVNDFLLSYKD